MPLAWRSFAGSAWTRSPSGLHPALPTISAPFSRSLAAAADSGSGSDRENGEKNDKKNGEEHRENDKSTKNNSDFVEDFLEGDGDKVRVQSGAEVSSIAQESQGSAAQDSDSTNENSDATNDDSGAKKISKSEKQNLDKFVERFGDDGFGDDDDDDDDDDDSFGDDSRKFRDDEKGSFAEVAEFFGGRSNIPGNSNGSGWLHASSWGGTSSGTGGFGGFEDRMEIAREIQDLVRQGYRELEPKFYAEAAESVERLPSGSLTRRYLSGFIMNGQGNLVVARDGNTAQAGELLKGAFEHAMTEASEGLGDDRFSDIVSFASDLAINHIANGRFNEAEKLLKRALYWVSSSRVEPDRPLLVATLSNIGQLHLLQNRPSAALDQCERAFVEAANVFGSDNDLVRPAMLTHLSTALRLEGITERALEVSQSAVDAARTSHETMCKTTSQNERIQSAHVLAAALVNRAICVVENMTSFEDVELARALTTEALKVNPDKSVTGRVPALLIQALLANSCDESRYLYEAIADNVENEVIQHAMRENAQVMMSLREAPGAPDAEARSDSAQKDTTSAEAKTSQKPTSDAGVEVASTQEKADAVESPQKTIKLDVDEEVFSAEPLGRDESSPDFQEQAEAEDQGISEEDAARNLLHRLRIPTTSTDGASGPVQTVWVQSKSAFVHGVTLRAFCKQKTSTP